MKKIAASLLTVLLVTGFTAAAHNSQPHAGDSGGDAVSDTPNAGKTAGPPEDKGQKPEEAQKNKKKGIQNAITNVPSNVAESVLSPIQNFEPGKALGNALKGVGEFLGMQNQETNETMNEPENDSIQ